MVCFCVLIFFANLEPPFGMHLEFWNLEFWNLESKKKDFWNLANLEFGIIIAVIWNLEFGILYFGTFSWDMISYFWSNPCPPP